MVVAGYTKEQADIKNLKGDVKQLQVEIRELLKRIKYLENRDSARGLGGSIRIG